MDDTLELELKNYSRVYNEELEERKSLDIQKQGIQLPQDRLKRLGFTSSLGVTLIDGAKGKEAEFINTVNKVNEILAFIQEVKECFGEDTIVIKKSDFVDIIRKYDLQCGLFSDYTGIVPEPNIAKIEEVKYKIDKLTGNVRGGFDEVREIRAKYKRLDNSFSIIHYDRDGDESDRYTRTLAQINQLGFELKNLFKVWRNIRTIKLIERFPFYYDFKSIWGKSMEEFGIQTRNDSYVKNLFICAPRKEMKNRVKSTFIFRRQPEDPFICSLCEYGVIIYTAWGREAEDEMLNKYKNFLRR